MLDASNPTSGLFSLPAPALPAARGVSTDQSIGNSFGRMVAELSRTIDQPYETAESMAAGREPFDATQLVREIMRAERELNVTVRLINDAVRSLKTLENIQA